MRCANGESLSVQVFCVNSLYLGVVTLINPKPSTMKNPTCKIQAFSAMPDSLVAGPADVVEVLEQLLAKNETGCQAPRTSGVQVSSLGFRI